MELEKQCVSLELAKRLKELGVKQDSIYLHAEYKTGGWNVQDWHWVITESLYEGDYEKYRNPYSAFTVSELGDLMKSVNTVDFLKAYYQVMDISEDDNIGNTIALMAHNLMTQPDIGGQMLVYLLENDLLTPKE